MVIRAKFKTSRFASGKRFGGLVIKWAKIGLIKLLETTKHTKHTKISTDLVSYVFCDDRYGPRYNHAQNIYKSSCARL